MMGDLANDLREAIKNTFSDADNLGELVDRGTKSRWSLDQVAAPGDLPFRIGAIVRHARDNGWLLDLVDAAGAMRTQSQMIARLKQRSDFRREIEPEDDFSAVFIRGRPLVDRLPLRAALRNLDGGNGTPFFVIDGDARSGKSYSATLINYMKSRRADLRVAMVELDALGQDGEVKAADIGASISSQLSLGDPPLAGQEQDARWVLQFCDWLVGVIPANDAYWIVVDGFGKVSLSMGARDLVKQLGRRVDKRLSNVRLILIDYDERVEFESLTRQAEYERVGMIPPTVVAAGLKSYFEIVYKERANAWGQTLSQTTLDSQVDKSVVTVLARMGAQDEPMVALGRAADEETRRIVSEDLPAVPGGG
jgi:hypothetical protein